MSQTEETHSSLRIIYFAVPAFYSDVMSEWHFRAILLKKNISGAYVFKNIFFRKNSDQKYLFKYCYFSFHPKSYNVERLVIVCKWIGLNTSTLESLIKLRKSKQLFNWTRRLPQCILLHVSTIMFLWKTGKTHSATKLFLD